MDIYTTTIMVTILIYIFIGNYAGRNVKQLDDYFVAGRKAPTLLIVGTLVASVMSSTIFLGEAGFTYDGQMGPYVLFPQIGCLGYIYGALLFGRYLRRSRAPTVADFFGQRFNSHRVQVAAGITIIVALGGYLLVVTQGAAILLSDLTDFTYTQSLIFAWFSYTAFTMYSGSQGIILTDTIMFLLFTIATFFFVAFIVNDMGGVASAIEQIAQIESKPEIGSWHGIVGPGTEWPTATDYLIWALVIDISWGIVFAVSPWQSSRHLMAKNEHVVIRASIYACLCVAFLQVMVYGVGGLINLVNPNISPSESVMIWASKNLVPELLGAILLAGIMAAALSSASTFLSLVGFSASNDIMKHKHRSTKDNLRYTRITMLVVGLLALVASFYFPPNLFWLTYFVGTVFTSSWGPVAFMSIWSKRITADAAFWGITSGFVFNVIPSMLVYLDVVDLPVYLDPIIIGAAVSLVVTIVVSAKGKVSRKEKVYRMRLHRTPKDERATKHIKATMIAAAIVVVYGCVMPFVVLHWYVLPYQIGAQTLAPDGGINWYTGEAVLAIMWGVIYVPVGLITAKIIWVNYKPQLNPKPVIINQPALADS